MTRNVILAFIIAAAPLAAQQPAPTPAPRAEARPQKGTERADVEAKRVEARAMIDAQRGQIEAARADARAASKAEAVNLAYSDAFRYAKEFATERLYTNMNLSYAGTLWGGQATPADSLYRRAHEEMNRGDYRKAATLFKELWGKYPTADVAADAMYWQAHALYRVGGTPDLQDALSVLDQMRTKYPSRRGKGDQGDVAALQVRIAGVLSTRGMGGQELVKNTLAQNPNICDREDQQVRAAALNALMQTDQDAATQYAQRMLARKDECSVDLRRSAVFLLGSKKDAQAATTLIAVARTDADIGVRASAISYLARIPGDEALNALDELSRTGSDDRIRNEAIRALARHPSPKARGLIKAMVEKPDNSEAVRMSALDALEPERATAEDLTWLQGLYDKTDSPRMKARVISAVARIGGPQNEKWFTALLANENEPLEARAVALQRVGPQMDITALGKLYDATGQRRLRGEIVNQFGRRQEPEATDKLVAIARSGTDPDLRRMAINQLATKKDPRATKLLLELIEK